MLRAGCIRCDKGQADVGGGHAGKLNLRFFRRFLQALHRHLIATQVYALLLFKIVCQPIDHALVKIIAAQVIVAGRGEHFLHAVAHLDDGYVKRAAAQVINHHFLIGFLINAVGKRRGRRLIDDALHFKACDPARILSGLALGIGEIGGHRNDGLRHLVAEIGFRICFQLLEDHGGNLLRRILLIIYFHMVIRAHLPLDRSNRAIRVRDRLTLCYLANHALASFGERNNAWRGARALCVRNDDRLAAFNYSYTRVCCA